MNYLLFLLALFMGLGASYSQQQQLLTVPQSSRTLHIGMDQIWKVQQHSSGKARVFTSNYRGYTTTVDYDSYLATYGACRLLPLQLRSGNSLAIGIDNLDRIYDYNDSLGVVVTKKPVRYYRIRNVAEVRDSILYGQCGVGLASALSVPAVDSVSIVHDTIAGSSTITINLLPGPGWSIVETIEITFEEPFDGAAPDATSATCTKVGPGVYQFTGFGWDDPATVVGVTYLTLTDMYTAAGGLVGQQQEFEVAPIHGP